jgi:hypothetical protein
MNGVYGGDYLNNGNDFNILTTHSFYSTNDAVSLQDDYVRKVVETVSDLDNVLYEIANEDNNALSRDWQYHMIDLIRKTEGAQLVGGPHPIGITMFFNNDGPGDLANSDAEWISPGSNDYINPPETTGDKVIILDTDHIGANLDHKWVWKSFTRGYNPVYMDQLDDPALGIGGATASNPPTTPTAAAKARNAMGDTKLYADRISLMDMTPQSNLSSTGYVLAKVSEEYLVYQPDHAEFTVDLPAGTYSVEWFDPVTRQTITNAEPPRTVIVEGDEIFDMPQAFSADAVLYLKIY